MAVLAGASPVVQTVGPRLGGRAPTVHGGVVGGACGVWAGEEAPPLPSPRHARRQCVLRVGLRPRSAGNVRRVRLGGGRGGLHPRARGDPSTAPPPPFPPPQAIFTASDEAARA